MKKDEIEFVSYDGSYPCLCYGTLTLKINGKEVRFNGCGNEKYSSFWSSGGGVSFNDEWEEDVTQGEWYWCCFDEKKMHPAILRNKDYVMELFNENVPWGCCGGCV